MDEILLLARELWGWVCAHTHRGRLAMMTRMMMGREGGGTVRWEQPTAPSHQPCKEGETRVRSSTCARTIMADKKGKETSVYSYSSKGRSHTHTGAAQYIEYYWPRNTFGSEKNERCHASTSESIAGKRADKSRSSRRSSAVNSGTIVAFRHKRAQGKRRWPLYLKHWRINSDRRKERAGRSKVGMRVGSLHYSGKETWSTQVGYDYMSKSEGSGWRLKEAFICRARIYT